MIERSGRQSTAAVLWLMIVLVFLPIAAAHVAVRVGVGEPGQQTTAR